MCPWVCTIRWLMCLWLLYRKCWIWLGCLHKIKYGFKVRIAEGLWIGLWNVFISVMGKKMLCIRSCWGRWVFLWKGVGWKIIWFLLSWEYRINMRKSLCFSWNKAWFRLRHPFYLILDPDLNHRWSAQTSHLLPVVLQIQMRRKELRQWWESRTTQRRWTANLRTISGQVYLSQPKHHFTSIKWWERRVKLTSIVCMPTVVQNPMEMRPILKKCLQLNVIRNLKQFLDTTKFHHSIPSTSWTLSQKTKWTKVWSSLNKTRKEARKVWVDSREKRVFNKWEILWIVRIVKFILNQCWMSGREKLMS